MSEEIFITLGSQKFQFNRLLKAIDRLCENKIINSEDVFAQIGYSDYLPQYYNYKKFLDREEFDNQMRRAKIVITHGGTGAIIGAVKKGKKVIAVPRLAKYGEHVDNHQIQIINEFEKLDMINACKDMDLAKSIEIVNMSDYVKYKSNSLKIIENIERYIEGDKWKK